MRTESLTQQSIDAYQALAARVLALNVPFEFWIAAVLVIFVLLATKWDQCKHLICIVDAGMQLKRLHKIKTPSEKLARLRGVNPFTFEEMLLTAFKKRGYKIRRNKRYTGDGGIDGHVLIKGQWYALQAKRYSHYINPKDVKKLSYVCRDRGIKGLFIHTGKTGKASIEASSRCPRIQIISGNRLLKLLD